MIKVCVACQRPYRTYVPNTICTLPDRGSVFYKDPQIECPLCDPTGYGEFMNKDLFLELQMPEMPVEGDEST